MPLFHVAPMLLAPGTILLPGNWGRVLNHRYRKQDAAYFREIALEKARALRFGEKPSRLNCVFALPNIDATRAYQRIGSNLLSSVYEIEPITGREPMHIGCWNLGHLDNGRHDLCDAYWQGIAVNRLEATGMPVGIRVVPEDDFAEILIGGEAKIVRRLDLDDLE